MTTYQLSGSDFNWKLTVVNKFKSVDNYVNCGASQRLLGLLPSGRRVAFCGNLEWCTPFAPKETCHFSQSCL